MKKISLYIIAICGLLSVNSCELFRIDNYDAPEETLKGKVVDQNGDPVLTDQGSEGIRVRLTELSYGDNVEHNPDFYCKPDGTFQNTKLFKGYYNIRLDGPFIPLIREDENGVPLVDETQYNYQIEGVTEVTFEVEPFLKVEFAEYPTASNGKVSAKVKVTRGVSKETFQEKVEPMGNYSSSFTNVTDIQLFVSYSSSVGYRARDTRWSNYIEYTGSSFESLLGTPVTIESLGTIPSGRHVFVRAAARINYDTPSGSGTKRWNYSEAYEVVIP